MPPVNLSGLDALNQVQRLRVGAPLPNADPTLATGTLDADRLILRNTPTGTSANANNATLVIATMSGDVTITFPAVTGTVMLQGGPATTDLDMDGNLILNIGATGTDFTAGGGLTLATDLNAANVITTGDVTSGDDVIVGDDLLFSTGGVISWNSGGVTITHSANALAFAGASSGYSFDGLTTVASGTGWDVRGNTADGSDTGFVRVFSGGAYGNGRGAGIQLYGVDHASLPGNIYIDADGAGTINLRTSNGGAFSSAITVLADRGVQLAAGIAVATGATITTGGLTVTSGNVLANDGVRIGADSGNNEIDDASQGAATTTLYIGNASITVSSDVRLKRDLTPTATDWLTVLNAVPVVDYSWNDPSDRNNPWGKHSRGRWTGLKAQDLAQIPELRFLVNAPDITCPDCLLGRVCVTHDSYWHVDLAHVVGPLIGAVQQLTARVAALEGN